MISFKAWRGRIGVGEGRVMISSKAFAPKMNVSFRQIFDILWDISKILVAAFICLILIVGGVEVIPGPPRKDLNSSFEDDLEVSKSMILEEFLNVTMSFHLLPLPYLQCKNIE